MYNRITISAEMVNGDLDSLVSQLKNYSDSNKSTRSCTGMEIATFILTFGQFLVALAAVPMLVEAINSKQITVKIRGVKLEDSVDGILDTLKGNPDFIEAAKEALMNQTIEIEGKGKAVNYFWKKLKEYLNIEEV